MKRAFTLIELLVVIAIIAILAAILFPVFAAAKASAKAAADLSNVKEHAVAINEYTSDFDDNFPLQSGLGNSQWGWNQSVLTPWNWAGDTGSGNIQQSIQYSVNAYANSIQPYLRNWDLFAAPGSSRLDGFDDAQAYAVFYDNGIPRVKYATTYAYNGELTNFNATGVLNPAVCPIITEVNGFAAAVGIARANPVLECPDPTTGCRYVASSAACADTVNGQRTHMIPPFGVNWSDATSLGVTQYTNKQGQNWAFCDGHAKYRQTGTTILPLQTNAAVEFYKQFNKAGVVDPTGLSDNHRTFWMVNLNGGACHSYLMNPVWNPF